MRYGSAGLRGAHYQGLSIISVDRRINTLASLFLPSVFKEILSYFIIFCQRFSQGSSTHSSPRQPPPSLPFSPAESMVGELLAGAMGGGRWGFGGGPVRSALDRLGGSREAALLEA